MIKNISDKQKLEYLNHLLELDTEFKTKFIKYFNLQEKVLNSYKDEDLDSVVKEIFEVFNGVDLELYMGNCDSSHYGYYDYYEDDISESLLEDLFLEIVKEINDYLKKGDFYQALFVLFAVGKAIDLEPMIEDEYGLLYDYHEILSEHHYFLISSYITQMQKIPLSFEDSKKFILFLLDNSSTQDELKRFEQLFDILITTREMALFLSSHILKFNINIQLKLLNLLDDNKTYINTAKKFYKEDDAIAKKLLEKIDEVSTYQEYESIAKECFEKNNRSFITEISKIITYEKSKDFYLELLRYKVLNHKNIDDYILYKKYLNEKEINSLQDSICESWSQDYGIKILEYEKKYERILALAKSKINIDLHTVLKPIKFYYPKECFEIIIQNCNQLMDSYDRNRKTYSKICRLLNIMIKVPAVKNDVDLYIKTTLINRKPNLPALKDELLKAGLI